MFTIDQGFSVQKKIQYSYTVNTMSQCQMFQPELTYSGTSHIDWCWNDEVILYFPFEFENDS